MDVLRISATDIDALRRYRSDEDASLSDLLGQLRRENEPSEAMRAGTALHAALERLGPGDYATLEADGYTFDMPEGEIALPAIREVKATRDYLVDQCRVTLVGKVDAIHGRRIEDHKFTARYDAERFLGSFQWRIYLEVFGADEFRWNVFEGRKIGQKHYSIHTLHPLGTHRYPGISEDVDQELRRFVEFARAHLPEKILPFVPTAADFLATG